MPRRRTSHTASVPPDSTGDRAGYVVYAEFVEKLLGDQAARKASVEQRGVLLVTTAGTLITLIFAVVGLATRDVGQLNLPDSVRQWLIGALALLLLAAGFGIAANAPLRYKNVRADDLRDRIEEHWDEDASSASFRVTTTRLEILEVEAHRNNVKVRLLFVGVLAEAAALVPLALALVQLTG